MKELTRRYFISRGPATLRDFVWWSGLTMKIAKEGVALLDNQFVHEVMDGEDYMFVPPETDIKQAKKGQSTFLMPDYDEYGISYKNRSAIFKSLIIEEKNSENSSFKHMIVIDGVIGGTWQKSYKTNNVVETSFFNKLNKRQHQAVTKAINTYKSFVG